MTDTAFAAGADWCVLADSEETVFCVCSRTGGRSVRR